MKHEKGGADKDSKDLEKNEKRLGGLLDGLVNNFYGRLSYKSKLVVIAALLKVFSPDAALAGDVKVDGGSKKVVSAQKADRQVLPPSMLKVLQGMKGFDAETQRQLNEAIAAVGSNDKLAPTSAIPGSDTRKGSGMKHSDPNINLAEIAGK